MRSAMEPEDRSDAGTVEGVEAGGSTLSVLLICDRPAAIAATVHAHIDALVHASGHRVRLLLILGDIPSELDLDRFDVILVHYTLVISDDRYLSPHARARLFSARSVKAVFVQDEYRHVNATVSALKEISADVLFTCVPQQEVEKVYPAASLPGLRKVNVLTGYVDDRLTESGCPPLRDRAIDVGYRARSLPAWLGDLGQEKSRIGTRFLEDAARYGLVCDISCREEERLYGQSWVDFLTRCKAILGVESGSSVFDFTGRIQAAVENDLLKDPTLSYETIRERHLKDQHGRIRLNQISPRCFEAAALRTLMILYEGEYSGQLQPWRHYVPLKKDHSNMDEVVATLRDDARSQAIVDRAYREIALNRENWFQGMANQVDRVLRDAHARRAHELARPYTDEEFAGFRREGLNARWQCWLRRAYATGHRMFFRYALYFASPATKDRIQSRLSRHIGFALKRVLR